ncbi:Hypothetical predicted protein [Octopus vulgaris]|uniref:Uncharacterized protein n=1 Tax=Octopus vulgaris TaxID=6645 RepID=A0AA36FF87_OCTVU|nr:Hypothetical predicted protein [Octopus vulgaris]
MTTRNSDKRKITRNYLQDALLLGVLPSNDDSEKSQCVDCVLIMTNDSIQKSKLQAHQQQRQPGSVGKERSYFEKKPKLQKNNEPKPLQSYMERANEHNSKILRAIYTVSELVAKVVEISDFNMRAWDFFGHKIWAREEKKFENHCATGKRLYQPKNMIWFSFTLYPRSYPNL